ncbi:MAG: winged helix-turn-helix transcriptional regulator [Nitrosarchaeum sp.]
MAETGLMWIYLIFLLIPLMKILPRVIKKIKQKKSGTISQSTENQSYQSNNTISESSREPDRPNYQKESTPKSLDMLVLGELNHGTRNFDVLQKTLGIDSETLDSVLDELEKKGLMQVVHKQGLFGPKVELHPTEAGAKKYYS